jgi:hypothetical protein
MPNSAIDTSDHYTLKYYNAQSGRKALDFKALLRSGAPHARACPRLTVRYRTALESRIK